MLTWIINILIWTDLIWNTKGHIYILDKKLTFALACTWIHLNTLYITEVDVDVCTYGIWPSNTSLSPILLSTPTFLFPSISPLSHPFPLLLLHYRAVRSDCTYFWCNWGGHADSYNTPPHIVKWGGGLLFVLFFIFSLALGWKTDFLRDFA